MTNVSEWSVTAGLNNSSPPDGWPEGMARSAVNDTAREMMAALARWYKDSIGTLTTAGGTTAYTLTTNSAYTALNDIPLLSIKANATNTGASTLAVDGLTAKNLTKRNGVALSAGDFRTGQVHVVAFDVASDRFELVNPVSGDSFDAGTTIVLQQTAAPTGWVKGATHSNKALRLTTGTASSGGSTVFTSVFTSRTIAQGNLPNFTLPNTLTVPDHTHGAGTFSAASHAHGAGTYAVNGVPVLNAGGGITVNGGGSALAIATGPSLITGTSSSSGALGVSGTSSGSGAFGISGSVTSGGSGTALDFDVQYVDVILATRS
jgi:hypothetical protein